ncbi:MAG: dephospho-CoA kinase [Desulfohalobiaceae bacterium]
MPQHNEQLQEVVPEPEQGLRLDSFWALRLQPRGFSRAKIGRWIKAGKAMLNAQICTKASARVATGDKLQLEIPIQGTGLLPVPGQLRIFWQDSRLLVLDKPPGLTVHPADSCQETTLVHYLLHDFPELQDLDPLRPGIVHRLDKDTSGLLMVARDKEAGRKLAKDLAQRRIQKHYLTLVYGSPQEEQAWIEQPLGRDPGNKVKMKVLPGQGRRAKTWYKVLYSFPQKDCSLLQVNIETGRTHQIRVHLAYIGHPVLGDMVYGKKATLDLQRRFPVVEKLCPRQMLHAWRLELEHPQTRQMMKFTRAVPKDFYRLLLFLQQRTQRLGITGQVGCGKSALSNLLAKFMVPVWSADKAVAELYQPGAEGWEMLRRSFGDRFLVSEQGPVDKSRLFQAMQDSQSVRQEVQSLIHPLVRHKLQEFWSLQQGARLAAAEVPLLLESGLQADFDVLLAVYCPDVLRRSWLAERRGWSKDQVQKMEAWQLSLREKLQGVHLILENPGHWTGLQNRAEALLHVLQRIRRGRMKRFVRDLHKKAIIQNKASSGQRT